MPNIQIKDGLNKFQRHRAHRKADGMKLLRLRVPDPHAPGLQQEARRQALLLRGAAKEQEALNLIAAAMADDDAQA